MRCGALDRMGEAAARGDADGRFHGPSGLGVIRDGRIVIVDQGNHRAQIFTPEGDWLSTFSLSSGYTTPRRRASDASAVNEESQP